MILNEIIKFAIYNKITRYVFILYSLADFVKRSHLVILVPRIRLLNVSHQPCRRFGERVPSMR